MLSYKVSINRNSNNNKEREQRRAFLAVSSRNTGALVIAFLLLASGGFVLISSTPVTSALAQEGNDSSQSLSLGNSTTTASSARIELSPLPVYQQQIRDIRQTPINQTHIQITYTGTGTLNLPNGTETIRITSSGSGIASMIDNDFVGKEIWTIEDGSETSNVTVYELLRFDMQEGTGRGITIETVHANSTGMLAPLDGMILTGITELYSDGTGLDTLWEWQSGIPYVRMPPESTMNATISP